MVVDSVSPPLLCRWFGHSHSARVWHHADGYRSQCKRCGIELARERGNHGWHILPPGHD